MAQQTLTNFDTADWEGPKLTLIANAPSLKAIFKPHKDVFPGNIVSLSFKDSELTVQSQSIANTGAITASLSHSIFESYKPPESTNQITLDINALYDALSGFSMHSDTLVFLTTDHEPDDPDALFDRQENPDDDWLYVVAKGDVVGYTRLFAPDNNTIDDPEMPTLDAPITTATVDGEKLWRATRGLKKYLKHYRDKELSTAPVQMGTKNGSLFIRTCGEESHFHAEIGKAPDQTAYFSTHTAGILDNLTDAMYNRSETPVTIKLYGGNRPFEDSRAAISYPTASPTDATITTYVAPRELDRDRPVTAETTLQASSTRPDIQITDTKETIAPLINSITTVTEAATVTSNDNALEITEVDRANTLLMDATIETDEFASATVTGNASLPMNTTLPTQLFRTATKTQKVTIGLTDDRQWFELEDIYTIAISPPDVDDLRISPDIPNLRLGAGFTVDAAAFNEAISHSPAESDTITMAATADEAFILGANTDGDVVERLDTTSTGEVAQQYDQGHLRAITNDATAIAESLSIEFEDEFPASFSLQETPHDITYVLAPYLPDSTDTETGRKYGITGGDAVLTQAQAEALKPHLKGASIESNVVKVE